MNSLPSGSLGITVIDPNIWRCSVSRIANPTYVLDDVEFEKLSAEGSSMTVEQAIALAMES